MNFAIKIFEGFAAMPDHRPRKRSHGFLRNFDRAGNEKLIVRDHRLKLSTPKAERPAPDTEAIIFSEQIAFDISGQGPERQITLWEATLITLGAAIVSARTFVIIGERGQEGRKRPATVDLDRRTRWLGISAAGASYRCFRALETSVGGRSNQLSSFSIKLISPLRSTKPRRIFFKSSSLASRRMSSSTSCFEM